MIAWKETIGGLHHAEIGILTVSITDQTDRHCGWCWHVSSGGRNGGDEIACGSGFAVFAAAESALAEWLDKLADAVKRATSL